MKYFHCPYLNNIIELTEEREEHIKIHHPDLLPEYYECIELTLSEPDSVRTIKRFPNALLFTKWFENVINGKYIVVVVITDIIDYSKRHWIVTSYITRKLSEGDILWKIV